MLKLIQPDTNYAESFKTLVWDFISHRETYYMTLYKGALEDFEGYVSTLRCHALGVSLPEGWVAYRTYWLVNSDNEVLGNIRIRLENVPQAGHIGYDIRPLKRGCGYGKEILRLGLEQAKTIGIDELYILVHSKNESSKRVIESCGGLSIQDANSTDAQFNVLKYRFDL